MTKKKAIIKGKAKRAISPLIKVCPRISKSNHAWLIAQRRLGSQDARMINTLLTFASKKMPKKQLAKLGVYGEIGRK